jgi:multidrug efflux pump subunit AcrA (membrane-fusion protein)
MTLALTLLVVFPSLAAGQSGEGPAAPAAGKPAIIERTPLNLRDPATFHVPLRLDPVRKVDVAARKDGVIANLPVKLGDQVQAQAEVARLETQERQLEFTRAQAAFKAAQAEQNEATGSAAAAARVDVARAELDLAQLRLDQCNIRSPLKGIAVRVHVVEGQFVQAGQPIVTIIDPAQLQAELPVDARSVKPGSSIEIKIEDETAPAAVQAVLPLAERFEPLRDLFLSVASGIAVIDNANGKFRAGQTVYSPMIPRLPVSEVPTAALSNTGDGERKVQVIRDGFVRDVTVQLLGQVGGEQVFVTGRFGPADELVLKSSETLLDGARVVAQDRSQAAPAPTTPSAPATRRTGGF